MTMTHWPSCCSGKTSLLLHYAHSLAVEGRSVLFICHKAKVEQVPPLLPQGVDSHDPALNNIHMRSAAPVSHPALPITFSGTSKFSLPSGTWRQLPTYRSTPHACICWRTSRKPSLWMT